MNTTTVAHFFQTNGLKVLVLLGLLLMVTRPNLDTDLGWHLRYGQYFFQTGHVLRDNIISFVWPSYHWVQASWGYDLLIYAVFAVSGFAGLSLLVGLVSFAIFFLITYPIRRLSATQLLFLAAVFLTQAVPLYASGIRSQTPSSLFFALVIILSYRPKHILFLPILFFLWANMHGGFALGLGLITLMWTVHAAMFLVARITRRPITTIPSKQLTVWGFAIAASYLTPLINPWGIHIYEETYKHLTNSNLGGITEWASLSGFVIESRVTLAITLLTLLLGFLRKKILDIPYLVAFLVVTYLAYNALRFLIPFALMAVYYLARVLPDIRIALLKKPAFRWLLPAVVIGLILTDFTGTKRYLFLPDPNVFSFTWQDYCANPPGHCSERISERMHQNPPAGNGFHPYEYGGYLSWRVPEVKTFVDGRMAAWEENGKTPPVIDGDRIVMESEPITFRRFDSQYHFQWIVVQTPTAIIHYLDNLVKNGQWEKRYQDEFYSYYVKKQ